MQVLIFLLAVLGCGLVLFSVLRKQSIPTAKDTPVVAGAPSSCSEIDYLFQRSLSGGLIDKSDKRNQVYERMSKLAPEIRRLTHEMTNLYDDLHSTWNNETVPRNLKEIDYQFGQKLITVPFEDRHRPLSGIPNFERPTFV